MDTLYDKTFLNSFFTTDEFDFINHLNDDSQSLESMLKSQQMYRDFIVKFINTYSEENPSEDVNDLLAQAQQIFKILNSNISALQLNIDTSNTISKKIMNLLIKIESDKDNASESKYINEIDSLKADISNYINISEEVKKSITASDDFVFTFFENDIVKNYLQTYSSTEDNNNKQNVENKNTVSSNYVEDEDIDIAENNYCLLISETSKKVYLPYTKKEVLKYLEQYPDQYDSFEDVVKKEFIYPIDFYLKHTVLSRFRETYSLIRDREAKSVLEAFKMAIDMMFRYDLNPAIIAACKSQEQLENYLECLKSQSLNNFKDFEIRFEISPLKK